MGKWNYRRRWTPKNYYRDQWLPTPPTYYETEYKLRGAWKNVELPWEERFCISVGIPWEKVVNAKKYMYCHDIVANWNDSAGEDTFCDAKQRFWDKINGMPSDIPQPDPDMYIDENDWNPEIDPELVKELDQAFFNPDEAEKVENLDVTMENGDSLVPGDDKNPTHSNSPWDCNVDKVAHGWNCSDKSANKNIINPWEQQTTEDDREIKDITWGACANKLRDKDVTWGGGRNSSWDKGVTWGDGASNSWHWNQILAPRADNNSKNTWASGGGTAGYVKENGWKSYRNSHGRGNSFGRERWQSQHEAPNGLGHQRHHGSNWESNVCYRKRESSQQYTSNYKSARVQSDNYGTGNQWGRQRSQNRVSFALD